MKTKHTPGQWTIESQYKVLTNVVLNTEIRVPYYEVGSELRRVATVDTGLNDKANAALIAAAPEMLEALEFVLDTWIMDDHSRELIKDVIRKAKGES